MSLALAAALMANNANASSAAEQARAREEAQTRRLQMELDDRAAQRQNEWAIRSEELLLKREDMANQRDMANATLAQNNQQFLLKLEEGRMARSDAASLRKAELKVADRQASLSFVSDMTGQLFQVFKGR